jgi:hypothetical protein
LFYHLPVYRAYTIPSVNRPRVFSYYIYEIYSFSSSIQFWLSIYLFVIYELFKHHFNGGMMFLGLPIFKKSI